MAKTMETKRHAPILRWKGLLADRSRNERIICVLLCAAGLLTLSFTQLGFIAFTLPDGREFYLVLLLHLVALGAALLGTLAGTFLGLFAGVNLLAHSVIMPLNPYEFTFITPVTSIVLLGASGFILGVLFAFVMRNDPPRPRRWINFAIVCVIVSWLFSIAFVFCVATALVERVVFSAGDLTNEFDIGNFTREEAALVAMQLGDVNLQAWIDAAVMTLYCILGDLFAEKLGDFRKNITLRQVFGGSLALVFIVAFMATSIASFVGITIQERDVAFENMESEVSYLSNQLIDFEQRTASLQELFNRFIEENANLSDEDLELIARQYSQDSLLSGYSVELDGIVLITYGTNNDGYEFVMQTDDPHFSSEGWLNDYLSTNVIDGMFRSVETESPQRVIYEHFEAHYDEEEQYVVRTATGAELAYVMSNIVGDQMITIIMPFSQVFANRWLTMASSMLSSVVLLAAVFLITFVLLDRLASRVDEVNDVLESVREGDLDARIRVRSPREMASLSDGINETVVALKDWIAEAETRMDSELATAKTIQESALPRVFPPFPDVMKFDIYATMSAAREVGGDFYDFFLIGDDCSSYSGKLGFVVADVSGKGVPAALFMMRAKALIRDYVSSGMEPGEALENANHQLCEGNDAGMFVTAWVGILDYGTGHIDFVNAGHNPPLIWQQGTWRWIKERSGLPLGLFDGLPYRTHSIDCQVGDQLLVYSDGVTEAMDADQKLYGEDRLMAMAQQGFALHPRELVDVVRRDVARHEEGADQSDDITILALEVGVPPEVTATLVVPARVPELERVNEFIHTELNHRLCPQRAQNQLDIAVEELFVNVANYAYPDATEEDPGFARVSYTYSADPPSVIVTIADEGIPYDPLAKPDAVTPSDIMDVPIGGLGILMAKKSVDQMSYERRDESNIVTIVKSW